jgi:putative endonuclease
MYFVYILANWNNRVLYIGVTNDLWRRLIEHKSHQIAGFTQKYNVDKLVYYEALDDVNAAIAREKQLKGWTRLKKNALVESVNQNWQELKLEQ